MSTVASAEDRLRRIGLVSDNALVHSDGEEMLVELLDRVREVLHVDTAMVLLLEPGAHELTAVAARGFGTEVRPRLRVPVGRGFAGRVAAEKKPVVLDRVDRTTVVNPLLWETGIRTLLGVPLPADGDVLGVLHVGSLTPRRFTEDDVELLQVAGDRIALAVQAQRARAARAAATELQRSLLPPRLPSVPFLDLAARYMPGGRASVAGDWYDVFTLPSGWLGIVIGDVVGHDLPAAVVMGRLRSALRAYALESGDPADVLTKLDRKVQHFEPGIMATVLYGVLEPAFERFHVSLAGHLPPVLAVPGRAAELLDLPIDPPIGALREVRRVNSVFEVPPGAVACFYTDGLVERRSRSIDLGLEHLRRSVTTDPADVVCGKIMAELIGEETPEDDVALLALRRHATEEIGPLHVVLPAVPESLKEVRTAMRRWLPGVGASQDAIGDLLLAVGEACTNVIEHAYGPGGGTVTVRLELRSNDVVATVRDTGRWRPPRGENRGRGLLLMSRCCDEVSIDRTDEGTTVVITYGLGRGSEH